MSVAEHYREWFQRLPKMPAGRLAPAHAAVDAFEAIERKRQITAADLAPLVAAARSPYTAVNNTGCNLLVELADRHPAARQCLVQLARDKRAVVRFSAVYAVGMVLGKGFYLSEPLRREIVERALGDRSTLVRRTAIEQAETFGFKDLLPRLEAMQRTETNDDVLKALAKHIPLLRDGFLLEPSGQGGYFLWVRLPGSLSGTGIARADYSEEFVRQQVARLRANG
jgi:hypothetical protein